MDLNQILITLNNIMEHNNENQLKAQEQKKDLHEFEIDGLIKTTYKKIAEWHNSDETTSLSLKYLTLEVIEDICGEVFKHFGLKYTPAIQMDKKAKEMLEAEKNKHTNSSNNYKPVEQMSDDELISEIDRRKIETLKKQNQDKH